MFGWYPFLIISTIFVIVECGFFKKNERIETNINYFKRCGKEEDNKLKININTHKFNRTHTGVNMNITLNEDFDNKYTIDVELRIWGDGGWKRNFFNYKKDDACNTLYLLIGKAWTEIIDEARANRGCPVKRGFYQFQDYFISLSNVPIMATPGRFLLLAHILKYDVPQLCLEIEFVLKAEIM